jgi:hypothetical protein
MASWFTVLLDTILAQCSNMTQIHSFRPSDSQLPSMLECEVTLTCLVIPSERNKAQNTAHNTFPFKIAFPPRETVRPLATLRPSHKSTFPHERKISNP